MPTSRSLRPPLSRTVALVRDPRRRTIDGAQRHLDLEALRRDPLVDAARGRDVRVVAADCDADVVLGLLAVVGRIERDPAPLRARPLAQLPAGWPAAGQVEFVRFIRSDRKLRLLNRAITMPETVVYEYVTAVLDLATPAADGNLRVLREGEIVATTSITIGGR